MIPVVIHILHRSSFKPDFICDDMLVSDHHIGESQTAQIPVMVLMLLIYFEKKSLKKLEKLDFGCIVRV